MSPVPGTPKRGSLLHAMRAVGWSFFGVRQGSAYQEDLSRLNPLLIIAAAFLGVFAFVGALVLLVRYVVAP